MAGSETLELIVNLRGDAKAGLGQVDNEVKKVTKSVEGLKSPIASVQKLLIGLGVAFTGATILSWIKEALSLFADFDDVMRQVKSISGATADEFERMTALAKKMGQETRFTATDSAKTLRILAQAGFSASESMTALPSVMTLASAGMVDLSQAADIASSAMNAYGLTAADLPSVNNVLVRSVNATNAELSDLGNAFAYVAPIARAFGADFEDLNAALGQLHNAGIKGSMAGTSLRGVLDALFTPTDDEAELMQKLGDRIGGVGLQIKNAEGQFVGFLSIVKQLEKANLTGAEALSLFGARAGPGMAALVNKGSESLSKLLGFLSETDDIAGKTAKDFEAGLGGALRELKSAVEGVKIALGDAFGEEARLLVIYMKDEVLKMVQALKDLKDSGAINGYAKDFIEAAKSIGTVLDWAILKPLQGWGQLLNWVGQQYRAFMAVLRGEMSAMDFVAGNFEKVRELLKDIGDSPDLAKLKVKLKLVGDEMKNIQKDLDDAAAGRPIAKLFGTEDKDTIDKFVEFQKKRLAELQNEWNTLAEDVVEYGKKINNLPSGRGGNAPLDRGDDFATRAGRSGPVPIHNIGRAGAKPVTVATAETKAQKAAREATSKAEMADYAANAKEFQALLNQTYQVGLIAYEKNVEERKRITNEFFEAQKVSATVVAEFEISKLQELANRERAGSAERIKLNSEIAQKKRELSAELIQIETNRYMEEYRLAQEAKQKKEQLEATKADIDIRIQANQIDNPFEREQAEQKLRLEEKHRLEMEALKKLTDDEAVWNDLARAQELEKQRQHEDQVRQLRLMQLDAAKQVASGVDDLMTALYEGSGKKVKAFFYIAKAAAMAEAIINIAQGVTKALGQGGYYGIFMGAAVAASGAVQLSKIASQQMASGGLIEGSSPTTRSDDKLIAATSGEYMQPVKAVRAYGVGFMNAIRNLQFPRELAAGFTASYPLISPSKRAYASGGAVGGVPSTTRAQEPEKLITINNIVDPNLLGNYLASAPGNRQLLNVISNNQFAVKQILFSNG